MSETPPKPDGSDPRVLTPDTDEPDVVVSRGNSSSKKYHTQRCSVVENMRRDKTVSRSVAEWNGHEKCDRCHRIETGDDYERPGAGDIRIETGYHSVSVLRCLTLRALALHGHTSREVAAKVGVSQSTAMRHISGKCECEHYGHSIAYDSDGENPHPADDAGVPEAVRSGERYMPPTTCAHIRRLLAHAPVSAKRVAALFGASDTAVRRHAKATDKCQHDHADTHPPVRYDHAQQTWVVTHDDGGDGA